MLSESNQILRSSPNFRRRYWYNVVQAYQIQRLLLEVPNNVCSPILSRLCSDVIRKANESFTDLSASPVRYEPYVLCIEGCEGIGKSYMTHALVRELLEGIGYTALTSDMIYTVQPGTKYWSSYRDQPVVVFDDWMNINDNQLAVAQLNDLYRLKSTGIFIPEMAELEEKKIRANPLVVVLLCNGAFPDAIINQVALYPRAVYRRRDLVVSAKLKDLYANKTPRDIPREVTEAFEHLVFAKYNDVKESNSLNNQYLGYGRFLEYVKNDFMKYHEVEKKNVSRRMEQLRLYLEGPELQSIRIQDPFALFYRSLSNIERMEDMYQNAYLPSEVLELQVSVLVRQLNEQMLPPIENVQQQGLFDFLEWIDDSCEYMVNKIVQMLIGPSEYAECCVCKDFKLLYVTCNNGHNIVHPLCYTCYHSLLTIQQEFVCPMCRHAEYRFIVPSKCVALILWLQRHINKENFIGLLKLLCAALTPYSPYICILISRWRKQISLDEVLIGNFAVTLASIGIAMAQNDDMWEAPVREAHVPLRNYPISVDEVKLGDLLNDEQERVECPHRNFTQYWGEVARIRYTTGFWLIPAEDLSILVKIAETPCTMDSCPLKTIEFKAFVRNYVAFHARRIRSVLLSISGSENLADLELLKSIPIYAIPVWAYALTPMLEQQLQQVTPENWWTYITEGVKWKKIIAWLMCVTGGLGILYGIYKFLQPMQQYPIEQSFDVAEGNVVRHFAQRNIQPRVRQAFVASQTGVGDLPIDVAMQNVYRNSVIFRVNGKLLKGVGLFNHYLILPKHYALYFEKYTDIEFTFLKNFPYMFTKYTYDKKDFVLSDSTDIALMTMPKQVPIFKDIRKYMMMDEEIKGTLTSDGIILLTPNTRLKEVTVQPIKFFGYQHCEKIMGEDSYVHQYYDLITYNYSLPGTCGDIVFRENSQHPIVGMHVAGVGTEMDGKGYAVILTKEMWDEALKLVKHLPHEQLDVDNLMSIKEAKLLFDEDVCVEYVGTIPKDQIPFVPAKSQIVPSLLQGVVPWKPQTDVCVMHKNDPRYKGIRTPLIAGCMAHSNNTIDFPSSSLHTVQNLLFDLYYVGMLPALSDCTRLTVEEALVGFPSEYYDPVDLTTSMGWPWVCDKKKGNQKKDWIVYGVDTNSRPNRVEYIDERILIKIKQNELDRRKGIIPATVFIDHLKDERKKIPKVYQEGATRIFCISPIEYTIAIRQNFLHFCASYMKNRLSLQHAVGVAVDGPEWSEHYRRLARISVRNIIALDYKNFGPGFNSGAAEVAFSIIIRWTMQNVKGVNETELWCLAYECLNSLHLSSNLLYRQRCGSPSGAAITVVINSLVNEVYIMLVWCSLWEDISKLKSPIFKSNSTDMVLVGRDGVGDAYKKHVSLIVYGDDLIMSVSDHVKSVFCPQRINSFFQSHNIIATDVGQKEGKTKDFIYIEQATFLKRHWRRHPMRDLEYLAPIEETSILDCCLWIWQGGNKMDDTYENADHL